MTLVSAAGLDPRSTLVLSVHIALRLFWLVVMAWYASGLEGAAAMLVCALLRLWCLSSGTQLSDPSGRLLVSPALRHGG